MSGAVKIECSINFQLIEANVTVPILITCFVEYNGKRTVLRGKRVGCPAGENPLQLWQHSI